MEDKVIKVTETKEVVHVQLNKQTKIACHATTIDTYFESGRKDCTVVIGDPVK